MWIFKIESGKGMLLFETINTSLITYVKDLISTAILHFEPRIKVENISVNADQDEEGLLLISLDYIVRTTNSRHNFVYPFYKNEGTNL